MEESSRSPRSSLQVSELASKCGGFVALTVTNPPFFVEWGVGRVGQDGEPNFDRGFDRGPDGRFDGDGFADTDPVVEASQRDETDEPPGTTAFIMLVERIQAILDRNGDERDPFFVAVQLHTWIHGIVDLTCRHPAFEWPTIDELLDDLIVWLDLDSPSA